MEKTQLALSKTKEYLEKMGTTIPIPNHELMKIAVNKARILKIAIDNKLTPPATLILTQECELNQIVKTIGTPFIMKTSTETNILPGPGNRYFVIKNDVSQEAFLLRFRKLVRYGPVILQRYVRGVGIGASFIFSKDSKLIAFYGHKRILERFQDGGPSVIAETYFHPDAVAQGFKLLTALNWQGVAMTEFKLGYDGKLYFIEINPRFWGTLPLAIASGVNFPKLLVDYYDTPQDSINQVILAKKKIFLSCLAVNQLLVSLKDKNLNFAKEISRSITKVFKHGFPFIVEFEKHDLCPLIRQIGNHLRASTSKGKVSKIGSVFFGPHTPYEKLAKFNIRSVIDLREESEKANLKPNGKINYIEFPIEDDSAPEIESFLELISIMNQIVEKEPIYVYCRLGRGRAPTVVIAFLISKGVPINEAYSIVYNARPYASPNLIQRAAIYAVYKNYLKIRSENPPTSTSKYAYKFSGQFSKKQL
jgi:protein-tyrosine phosphatase/predicted ATP-grasp superfamily ATP-dependent carboligase